MPRAKTSEGRENAAPAASNDRPASSPVRRVVRTTVTAAAALVAVAVVAIVIIHAGMWWALGGSDWWNRDELRHALEDHYRDNPQAFNDAANVAASYAGRHPGADWISVNVSSVCVADPPLNGWECVDTSEEERAILAQIKVDKQYTGTGLDWKAEFDNLVFVNLNHETRDGGRLVHALDGQDLLGLVDDIGFECVTMLADDWCSMVRP